MDDITYYWYRDGGLLRTVGYALTELWQSSTGLWVEFEVKPWNRWPVTVEDAIDRLIKTGEWTDEGPSPFGPDAHRAPEEEPREEPAELVRYEKPQTGEYIYVEFI